MTDPVEVEDAISQSVTNLGLEQNVGMYLVTETKDNDNPFSLYRVEPRHNVPQILRDTLRGKLQSISKIIANKDAKIKDFLDIHRNPGDILVVKAEIVKEFQNILGIVNQRPTLMPPPNLKELGKIWGWTVEFDIDDARLIYFRKHTDIKVIGRADSKGKWPAELSNGKLTDLEGNILTFDDQIDGIYLENLDSIIVSPPHGRFETMFDFRDFYKKETTKALKSLKDNFLIMDDELIPKAAGKVRTAQRITKLSKSGIFEEIKSGKITSFFFEETRNGIGSEEITYDVYNGKLAIQDIKALDSFVDVCMSKYVSALAGHTKNENPQLFIAEYKHVFEKAKRM